jgi:ABC-2 type transport system permease protein
VLIADTLRTRRLATLVWLVGGIAFMVVIGYGYLEEVETYPGGAPAMGAGLEAAAQAMRLLRWPAERLDTFGGYITYHNVTFIALGLGVWGAIQGVALLRGARAEGQLECILAAGCSRRLLLASRVTGWATTLIVITAGIGVGLAAATAIAGVFDLSGSMITMGSVALVALACFGLGLALAQMVGTVRVAAGLTVAAITGLYLLTNVWEELGWFGGLRYLSPFYYSNRSRALVPGHSVDLSAMAALAVMTAAAVCLAVWAFERRDLGATLWRLDRRAGAPHLEVSARPYWWAESSRRKLGLAAWSLGAAILTGLIAWLEPVVVDIWDEMGFSRFLLPQPGVSLTDRYLSFASQLVAALIAGYAITQTAGWVAEMRERRVEMFLSQPVSWRRLILQRLATATVGVLAISTAAAAGLALGAAAVDAPLNLAALVRTIPVSLILGLALLGLGAMLVAWMPTAASVILLSAVAFASYLLAFVIPLFDLPDWTMNLSLFGAYGQPYLELPDAGGLLLLSGLALAGGVVAPRLAERYPKV